MRLQFLWLTVLVFCSLVLYAVAPACTDSGGTTYTDSDADSDSDGDSDSDADDCPHECVGVTLCLDNGGVIEPTLSCSDEGDVCCNFDCPFECMLEEMCDQVGGTVVDNVLCDEAGDICCDWDFDGGTDTDIDTDIDTDVDSDTDADGDTVLILSDSSVGSFELTSLLTSNGFVYDARDNGSGTYTSVLAEMEPFAVVIFNNDNRSISLGEESALNQYVDGGGRLLVTGYDSCGSPTDYSLADVCHITTSGDATGLNDCTVTDGSHPALDGPYGTFPTFTSFTVSSSDHDAVMASSALDSVELIDVEGYAKLSAAEGLGLGGGWVYYWNGNSDYYDWETAGTPQDIFLNLLHHMVYN